MEMEGGEAVLLLEDGEILGKKERRWALGLGVGNER